MNYSTIVMAILLVTSSALLHAAPSQFKCNNTFIHRGDSIHKALSNCGQPLDRFITSGSSQAIRETLIYYKTGGQRKAALNFRQGKLVSIDDIGR